MGSLTMNQHVKYLALLSDIQVAVRKGIRAVEFAPTKFVIF